jgi:hypothetical protein
VKIVGWIFSRRINCRYSFGDAMRLDPWIKNS